MTDLVTMMSPIRDTIARTREKMEQIERLMVTATEADKLECTSAAECAVEQARRLLADLNGKAGELPKPTPVSVDIDRTLPPGFEVRKYEFGWCPVDMRQPMPRCFVERPPKWVQLGVPVAADPNDKQAFYGDGGYATESAAYADKARWINAAGVDWPEVTGPHEDGNYDIRTSTHWWLQSRELWTRRNRLCDVKGVAESKKEAERHLPAACRAWVEMQKEAGR